MADSLILQIARWCVGLRFEDIPDEVIDIAKTALTDYVAVTIAGSDMPVAKNLQQFAIQRAPQGNCSVFGTEQKAIWPMPVMRMGLHLTPLILMM